MISTGRSVSGCILQPGKPLLLDLFAFRFFMQIEILSSLKYSCIGLCWGVMVLLCKMWKFYSSNWSSRIEGMSFVCGKRIWVIPSNTAPLQPEKSA